MIIRLQADRLDTCFQSDAAFKQGSSPNLEVTAKFDEDHMPVKSSLPKWMQVDSWIDSLV